MIIIGYVPLSITDIASELKISKDIVKLNSTNNPLDLTEICRILHPKRPCNKFFLSSHGPITKQSILCTAQNTFTEEHIWSIG